MIVRLTVPEAATAARKHPVTVRRALESGRLHGTQQVVGGRWTVRADCLDAWCDGQRCEHQAAAAAADSNVVPMQRTARTAS